MVEACNTHNQGPHTFQCNQYDGWDQSPWTYEVPIGDFCSTPFTLPVLPKCAEGNERDAPKISITDAEGTDCSIEMYKAPSDPQNMECLNKLTNGNGQNETWLVFVVHGFCTDCHGSTAESWDWGFRLREGVLARYEKSFSIIHLYVQPFQWTWRYNTTNRRVIAALFSWGGVSGTRSINSPVSFVSIVPGLCRPAITTMVMGHLLGRLTESIQSNFTGNLTTFCIGSGIGGQVCGFAGKNYRQVPLITLHRHENSLNSFTE